MLEQRLRKHPELAYERTGSCVSVQAPSAQGFSVSFHAAPNEFTVHFEGWHEHFETAGEALECFAFAFSGQCRLWVVYYGSRPVRWALQCRKDGSWVSDSDVGCLLFPFWRRRRVEYLYNPRLLEPA